MCTWETENRDSVTCETSSGLTFKPESQQEKREPGAEQKKQQFKIF